MRPIMMAVSVAAIGALVWALWEPDSAPEDPAEVERASSDESAFEAAPIVQRPQPATPQMEMPDVAIEDLLTEEEIAVLEERERRQLAARERFSSAVQSDRLRPEQVSDNVRAFFADMDLEPVVSEERMGMINGMRINWLDKNHPLAQAGFEEGVRLTRIDGDPLQDPADIAHLPTRMGDSLEVCGEQDGRESCHYIQLSGG